MAFEYIGSLLEEAVQTTTPVDVRGRVEQVVGTIIRAVVPGVKVGELCILRNPWEDFTLKAEVVGFVRNVALLSPLGSCQGVSPATEVIPRGRAARPSSGRTRPAHRRRPGAQDQASLSRFCRSAEPHDQKNHQPPA